MSKDPCEVRQDLWTSCYRDNWNGLIVPEAMAHPAKMARGLCRAIFDHAKAEGWLPPKSLVIDPFLGIGTTALEALLHGCAFIGNELEPRFFSMAQDNLSMWMQAYKDLPGFGPWAMLTCGDSRELVTLLQGPVALCVASPPYESTPCISYHTTDGSRVTGGRMTETWQSEKRTAMVNTGYGQSPANLGNLPVGCAISSPPYAGKGEVLGTHNGIDYRKAQDGGKTKTPAREASGLNYGEHPGNLGNLPTGPLPMLAVSSPPFSRASSGGGIADTGLNVATQAGQALVPGKRSYMLETIGDTTGQLGTTQGDTFWSAAAQIVAATFQLLTPGGHAIWVVKSYVREGKIVDFPGDWRRCCEAVGFLTLHEHHAMLVEEHGTQGGLFGEDTYHTTARKSFFRRLHERKRPDLAIDYEVVLCMVKPSECGDGGGHVEACISSPPYAQSTTEPIELGSGKSTRATGQSADRNKGDYYYGSTTGNLGNLPIGCIISSPPYAHSVHDGNGIDASKLTGNRTGRHSQAHAEGYGHTPGNLGNLPVGTVATTASQADR